MPLRVSYMGTKRKIASRVATVIERSPRGPMLDLFSGICSVGCAVAPSRQVWCNDVQIFASTVARAFFTSPSSPMNADVVASISRSLFLQNCYALEKRFSVALRREEIAFQSEETKRIAALELESPNVASCESLEQERKKLRNTPTTFPYRLFTITYSGAYLSLRQCIEVDSIRYSIDELLNRGELDSHQHQWMSIGLCQAVSKVATTTGHFAQFMRVKQNNQARFLAQRYRSVWQEWLRAIFQLSPVGSKVWRSSNRVFEQDVDKLLQTLHERKQSPAVVYADPPYTGDQYSRFYHLYETLLRYDYPSSQMTGRYRPDRFISRYSKKSEVESAMETLISGCARIGSKLVLSYPENGLLPNSQDAILSLIRNHYGRVGQVLQFDHFHSSLGGSKGQSKYAVKELIYTAG